MKTIILAFIALTAGSILTALLLTYQPLNLFINTVINSDSAPAWIQAIGSVLAIVAAAIIARRQNQTAFAVESTNRAIADRKKFEVIKALMVRTHLLSNDICQAFETLKHEDFDKVSPKLMADTYQALQALPIFEVPNALLALDVLMISRGLTSMQEDWNILRAIADDHGDLLPEKLATLNALAKEVQEITRSAIEDCNMEIENCKSLGL